ncbi:MAG: DUF5916 domain-containing protein [Gemmatimonadota bacterium]
MHPFFLPILAPLLMASADTTDVRTLDAYDGSTGEIRVQTPATANADIVVDGRLDDLAWGQAAVLHGFTQFQPSEGIPASQPTETLVLVDEDAVYFGIRAFDSQAERIRSTLTERDGFTRTDDWVRVLIDTYDDQRGAFVFTVNPDGVQHDGVWSEGGGGMRGGFGPPIDDNPDFLWDANAEITADGYVVEIRIPFKSLRFPQSSEQSWGLQVVRRIQRSGFNSAWAPQSSDVANELSQYGKLAGLRDLDAGLFLELNPVLTGSRVGNLDESADRFIHEDPSASFGFNATYGVTSNLTLDATYNPDFSQVEADAGQISVNERFAIFLPEKRPFFLEGTEIFSMPRQLVYTRSVVNPIVGAKLTGKVGGVNLGYMGAVDEPFDATDPNTAVNLVRMRRDLGTGSTLGAVYTDRTAGSTNYNRVAGADARLRLGGRYTVSLMSAASFTQAPGGTERADGRLMFARVERSGRALSYNAEFEDTSPEFRAGSGFFRRVGDTQMSGRAGYSWYAPAGSVLQSINPSLNVRSFWDHDQFWAAEGPEELSAELGGRVQFQDNITLYGNYSRTTFSFVPESYEGLFVEEGPGSYSAFRPDQDLFGGLDAFTVGLWLNKWEKVRGNARFTVEDTPIFDRSFGVAVEPARSYSSDVSLNLFPFRGLTAELGLRQTRLVRDRDGTEHSSAVIPRVRAQYQFSRAIFVRSIFEYSSQDARALRAPVTGAPLYRCVDGTCSARSGSDGNDFHVEALVAFEPSPGTVFFLGYSRDMRDPVAFDFRELRPTADGLFVKLSYRFRM